jgi:predicted RNA polymerase sigma factor
MTAAEPAIAAVFRRSSAALVATLTHALGAARLDLVEAVVQDAFGRAVEDWRAHGIPDNPGGWLHTVARRLALDHLRRDHTAARKQADVAHYVEVIALDEAAFAPRLAHELDRELAMIFVACHPVNTPPSQVALALRTLCGLDVAAIARAMFATDDAIDKRLVLARRRLRDARVTLEVPAGDELAARLDAVLVVLYLLFNEAHGGVTGPALTQDDVAAEAIRLATLVADHPRTARPRVHALAALMHLHAARFPARVDADGYPVPLPAQDRARWDGDHIAAGLDRLARSSTGAEVSTYHFEAAIAALHVTAPSHAATDWARVVAFYDDLIGLSAAPGARLSRAIALGFRDGPARALAELEALRDDPIVHGLAPFHAARGEALVRAGDAPSARAAYERALALSPNPHERRWIARELERLR